MSAVDEAMLECAITAIGWATCLVLSAGTYLIGCAIAPHVHWGDSPHTLGMLSTISFIWMVEHRHFAQALKGKR